MTPFRILMVLDQPFPPDARVEQEARSLHEAGFDVSVLAIAPDDRPHHDSLDGITIYRDPVSKPLRNKMRGLVSTVPLMDWYVAWRIRRLRHEHPFDVLHVHDLYLGGAGLRAARQAMVPLVLDLHENWVEALKHYAWSTRFPGRFFVSIPRWERTERKWVHAADHLVVVIEEAADRHVAMDVPRKKIAVVPNTVDLEAFRAYELDKALVERLRSPLTLVYTGGIDAHRGLKTVLEAMPLVLADVPGAQLVIVGDGRTRGELELQAAALGLGEHVSFEGWQPQERLKSYIAAADVGLVPHLKTGHTDATIPHKLFHYMFMKTAVVVTDCRPLERIVREEQAGLVVRSGDADDLASAVVQLYTHPSERRAMGARGRLAVLERYHWKATVIPLIELYRSLASQDRH